MAHIAPSFDKQRQNLYDILPLSAPFHIGIEPTRQCNLKCFFCQHSTRGTDGDLFEKKRQTIQNIDFDLFKQIAHQIMQFPVQPKKIQLAGMGEPILNSDLGKMARYLRSIGFDGTILTYTNGVGLTPEIVRDLTREPALTAIQVSVYGMTEEDFTTLAGTNVNIDIYLEKLRYLYQHKNQVQIRLKTTDDVVRTEADRVKFYDMFGPYCDQIYVEHIINIPNQMGYNPIKTRNLTQYSEMVEVHRQVCPWMFYQLHVNSDGDVFFCDILAKPKEYSIGNVKENSLVELWNGSKRNQLICDALKDGQDSICQCIGCDDRNSMTSPKETVDNYRNELLMRFSKS